MTGKPINDDGLWCPLWKKRTKHVCHTCKLYVHIRGEHPQTGAILDHWDCAQAVNVLMQTETARQVRTAAHETNRLYKFVQNVVRVARKRKALPTGEERRAIR